MKTVLLTGFEPFGGDTLNPSGEIARQLDGMQLGGWQVRGAVLPCVFGKSARKLERLMEETRPELVIGLGLANGRAEITPERVAINVDDARIADNAGRQPVDRPIAKDGPAAYWSTLPIKAIVAALKRNGIPASVSQTAGTFVCNHVFYALMRALAAQRGKVRGGFIHIPWAEGQEKPGQPALPLDVMKAAIVTAIEVAIRRKRDVRVVAGATH